MLERFARRTVLIVVTLATSATVADGVVLCARPRWDGTFSASVKIREICASREVQLDPVLLGLQGPKGNPGDPGPKGDQGDPGPQGLAAWERPCPPDSIPSWGTCIDMYEASVWRIPTEATTVVQRARDGTVTLAELTAAGATQLGVASDDYAPCADGGQNCLDDIYAVSLPGVTPSTRATWFQAQAACESSGKRLPSNAEWQAAVIGTPDPGPDNGTTDCNSSSGSVSLAGSRGSCRSTPGAYDMVGNLYEWVADWGPRSTTCGTWSASVSPTGDAQCLAGAATTGEPGAVMRGGYFSNGAVAGPFTANSYEPSLAGFNVGFRCAR